MDPYHSCGAIWHAVDDLLLGRPGVPMRNGTRHPVPRHAFLHKERGVWLREDVLEEYGGLMTGILEQWVDLNVYYSTARLKGIRHRHYYVGGKRWLFLAISEARQTALDAAMAAGRQSAP